MNVPGTKSAIKCFLITGKQTQTHRFMLIRKGHLALDVDDVNLAGVVLGDELHHILLLEGIFIHPLHGTHTLDGN